jgi:hypothetical protein
MAGGRRLAGSALLAVLLMAGCSALAPDRPPPAAAPPTSQLRLPAARPAAPGPVLAALGLGSAEIVRLDPRTLRRLPGPRLRLPDNVAGYSFSDDRSTLVLGDNQLPTLYVVDATRLRLLGEVALGLEGSIAWLGWLGPRRLVAVSDTGSGTLDVALVDPAAGRALARHRLAGAVSGAVGGSGRAVLLLTPADSIGPARLAVVDASGAVRTVGLPGITAGFAPPAQEGSDAVGRQRGAGLAVDPAGGRAFVVTARAPVVEVDLASLRVTSKGPRRKASALRGLARWLLPPAEAKLVSGPLRQACWLGDGLLAVWGSDARVARNAAGELQGEEVPSGVRLLDARTWAARPLDGAATMAVYRDGRLLTFGGAWTEQGHAGTGLTVYGPGDHRPLHLLRDRVVLEAHANGTLAYVGLSEGGDQGETSAAVVSLTSGKVLARLADSLPYLLLGPGDTAC